MAHNTTTECLLFPGIFSKPVTAQFDQRQGSSDGGAILLKAADRRLGLTESLAACLVDKRQPAKVQHETEELLGQRLRACLWLCRCQRCGSSGRRPGAQAAGGARSGGGRGFGFATHAVAV